MMTTKTQVRTAFWSAHPQAECRKSRSGKPLPQNLQPTDTRCAFVDFVDYLARSGEITEALARRVTL